MYKSELLVRGRVLLVSPSTQTPPSFAFYKRHNIRIPLHTHLHTDYLPILLFLSLIMFMKAAIVVFAMAAPALAYETVTCKANATQNIVTMIKDQTQFCTMLPGYGVTPVAPNEGCASVYCYGAPSSLGPPMPKGYILSANYLKTTNYTQVTGCIDSSVWGQNPMDEGGQMDSHGWPYSCQGYPKFVSLIEPATNTFCIRCCNADNNIDCNTSKVCFIFVAETLLNTEPSLLTKLFVECRHLYQGLLERGSWYLHHD
jgi:hypothetical protein